MTDRLKELLSREPTVAEFDIGAQLTAGPSDDRHWRIAAGLRNYRRALVLETLRACAEAFDDLSETKGDMNDPMCMARNTVLMWIADAEKEAGR